MNFFQSVFLVNKAYRPNAHMSNIIMQLKYQFAIRIRFRISIKRLLVVPTCIFVHNILKLSLTKKHMNFNMHTVPAKLLNAWTISMQYLTIPFK